MSHEAAADHLSKKRAVYSIAGMERAAVRKDVAYRTTDGGPLTMEVYHPADAAPGARLPAVLLVEGAIRRDFSLRVKERILQFGFALLVLLMGIVKKKTMN